MYRISFCFSYGEERRIKRKMRVSPFERLDEKSVIGKEVRKRRR
jgi:hypothetical protein